MQVHLIPNHFSIYCSTSLTSSVLAGLSWPLCVGQMRGDDIRRQRRIPRGLFNKPPGEDSGNSIGHIMKVARKELNTRLGSQEYQKPGDTCGEKEKELNCFLPLRGCWSTDCTWGPYLCCHPEEPRSHQVQASNEQREHHPTTTSDCLTFGQISRCTVGISK